MGFATLDERGQSSSSGIQTIFNHVNLDREIPGFMTLTTSGRGLVGRNITTNQYNTVRRSNRSSTYTRGRNQNVIATENTFLGSSVASRQIDIKYRLVANDMRSYRQTFERLNAVLHVEECMLRFTDDTFHYIATPSDVEIHEEGGNVYIGTISMECTDPFKYGVPERWEFRTSAVFDRNTQFPMLIEEIEMEVLKNGDRLQLENRSTGQRIHVQKAVAKGYKFQVFPKKGEVRQNGLVIMNVIDPFSSIETFELSAGDEILTNVECKVSFRLVERRL